MKFLSLFLMFAGYTLVYAGIANQGAFATDPWMGLFADAYGSTGGTGSGVAPPPSPGAQPTPRAPTAPSSPSVAPAGGGGGGGPSILKGILHNFTSPFTGGLDLLGLLG